MPPKSKEEERRAERLTTAALARHSSQPAAQKGPTKIDNAPITKKKTYDENIYSMGEGQNLKVVQYNEAPQDSNRETGVPRANETNSLVKIQKLWFRHPGKIKTMLMKIERKP